MLAIKYNEDFEVPPEFTLEICKRLKVFSCQNQINKWESNLIVSIDHRLFVSQNKFETWIQILQWAGQVKGPYPFKLIDDYFGETSETEFSDPEISLQSGDPQKPRQSGCAILLERHIFLDRNDVQKFYQGEQSASSIYQCLEAILPI